VVATLRRIRLLRHPAAAGNRSDEVERTDFKGGQSENCGPNAVADFIVWWDRTGLLPLPLPKQRDEMAKAEWVHERLFGLMRSGGGTSLPALCEGVKAFFERHYEGKARPRFDVLGMRGNYLQGIISGPEAKPFTLAAVAEQCTGHKAVVLQLSQLTNGRPDAGHYVALLTADAEGKVLVNTWGRQFRGRLKQLDAAAVAQLPARLLGPGDRDGVVFELVVANTTSWMEEQQLRWLILPADGVLVIEPVLAE
jgi:hypothetical protein